MPTSRRRTSFELLSDIGAAAASVSAASHSAVPPRRVIEENPEGARKAVQVCAAGELSLLMSAVPTPILTRCRGEFCRAMAPISVWIIGATVFGVGQCGYPCISTLIFLHAQFAKEVPPLLVAAVIWLIFFAFRPGKGWLRKTSPAEESIENVNLDSLVTVDTIRPSNAGQETKPADLLDTFIQPTYEIQETKPAGSVDTKAGDGPEIVPHTSSKPGLLHHHGVGGEPRSPRGSNPLPLSYITSKPARLV